MTDLIMRAEQGVLGALLAGRDHTLILDSLLSDDFAHPTHRAIYTAVGDLHDTGRQHDEIAVAVAAIVDRPDVDATWLATLAAAAPDSNHLRAYLRIVIEASFDRDTSDFAQPYLTAADQAIDADTRASLLRTGQALQAQAEVFATLSSVDEYQPVAAALTILVDGRLNREELIIADLIQHPDQAQAIAAWLISDVFTTEQRRMIFEVAVSAAYHGDPIDAVIVAWHAERLRQINNLYGRHTHQPEPPAEPDYPYLARLEVAVVAAGTAVIIGHELVHEHTTATLAVSATAAVERAPAPVRDTVQPQIEAPLTPAPTINGRRIEL